MCVTQNETAMAEKFVKLVNVMKKLREPDGCPWDREQTYMSLRRYIVEEGYELIQAIEDGNVPNMCEECGDLMLQVVFVSCMAEERGDFTVCEVLDGLTNKLIRRHPHVFGEVHVDNSDDVLKNWEQIKSAERKKKEEDSSYMAGIPRGMPALLRAYRILRLAQGRLRACDGEGRGGSRGAQGSRRVGRQGENRRRARRPALRVGKPLAPPRRRPGDNAPPRL